MLSNGFKINKVNKFVNVKNTNKYPFIVCFFIDVMLILSSNDCMIKSTNKILTNKFDMKNLDIEMSY